jgi:spermidine synthase
MSALVEKLGTQCSFQIHDAIELARVRSPFQEIAVYATTQFGRVLQLDGCNMTSERDEFFYHEAMVHPALTAQRSPRNALVIGGGDGGAARQILLHPSIERVIVAELDAQVVRVCRQWLPSVSGGAFDDPRVTLSIGDGFAFLQQSQLQFDLIVMDLTDPDDNAAALYSEDFYALACAKLTETGCLTMHLGSPFFHADRVKSAMHALRAVFAQVELGCVYVPLYGTLWAMAVASRSAQLRAALPAEIEARLNQRQMKSRLRLYCGAQHAALFADSPFLREFRL